MLKNKFIFLVTFLCFLVSCQNSNQEEKGGKPTVVVSVAPYKYFVERIAGDKVFVKVIVPPGVNHHAYEPTAKHMLAIMKSAIWFQVGEAYEHRIEDTLQDGNPSMKIVNLQEGVTNFHNDFHHCTLRGGHKASYDIHTWLSLKNAIVQAKAMAHSLREAFPEYKEYFQRGERDFVEDLQALDAEIHDLFDKKKQKCHVFVSHPAYSYFCKDYGIIQHALECEGREPHPQYIAEVMRKVKKEGVKTIFLQREMNNRGAKRVAETLNLKMVYLDPNAVDYLENMRNIAYHFIEECK